MACDNRCPIKNLEVDGRSYPFGGRCSKFSGARRRASADEAPVVDHVARRGELMFADHGTGKVAAGGPLVGVPTAFSIHSLWPFYERFFSELGVRTLRSSRIAPEGVARQESSYCFPVEIAHGGIQDLIDRKVDFLFLPHFRDMPSMEQGKVHACTCPLTQGLPYFARHAFGLDEARVLKPVVSFKHGWDSCRGEFEAMAEQLGRSRSAGAQAFAAALAHYQEVLADYRRRGQELLAEMQANPDRLYVAILGRPYNAFTRDANMGIPRKFTSRGVTVVPFDMIFDPEAEILPNMYWYYGQQDMKAVRRVKEVPNLFLAWVSNFSCAPDSFMLHYLRWMMGRKPYLVLEVDSHTADAGLDTRIEAFLDIVDSYCRHLPDERAEAAPRRYRVERKREFAEVVDTATGERIDIRDRRVRMIWPSMGDLIGELCAAAARRAGINAEHLPVPDPRSTQLARNVASGKECIPALLVLGSLLQFLERHPPNQPGEILLFYVPSTLGPCRTGQYHVFYDRLFAELGCENVALVVGESENSYKEFGPDFSKDLWRSAVLSDYFTDVRSGIRLLAEDPVQGLQVFEQVWQEVVAAFGRSSAAAEPAAAAAALALARIPRRRSIDEVKKVLIVGEIYVRRDTFSVQEITDHLIAQGIFPKVTGVTEWVHYTDFSQRYLLDAQWRREGLVGAIRKGWIAKRLKLGLEGWWMARVEGRVRRSLATTGFLPTAPADVTAALDFGGREFVSPELESEATISPAVAAAAMQDGYSGVAIIAPFACLPGRLIEGVFAPWARARGYPVLALENDGHPYPPNVVSRIEVFAHNVQRYEKRSAAAVADPR
jgi:predicted nucleotide-binding protein (sugar kinase/HSP70/actin superfamily)